MVLAFDGVDHELARRWIDAGELPNLAALARDGTFAPLATTNPADSPTSWASFVTATNPGRTGVMGFVRQRPDSYDIEPAIGRTARRPWGPGLGARLGAAFGGGLVLSLVLLAALARTRLGPRGRAVLSLGPGLLVAAGSAYVLLEFLPLWIARPVPARDGAPFWDAAADAGVRVIGLGAPMTFPPEPREGCDLLCGFGVPDVLGTMGIWTLYTSRALSERNQGESGRLVVIDRVAETRTRIHGPEDLLVAESLANLGPGDDPILRDRRRALLAKLHTSAELTIRPGGGQVHLSTLETSVALGPGEWSDWVEVRFEMSPVLSTRGMVRFRVLAIEPDLEIYMTPVQFVPDELPPGIAISSPSAYASDLWNETYRFATVGWPTATNALKDGRIDRTTFRETLRHEFESERALTLAEVGRSDWRLLLSFFYAPDRASHLLWDEPEAILETYRWMDELVGEVRERTADGSTALLVVSDHGFREFRKEVHLNAWLREKGWLTLVHGSRLPAGLQTIDWSRTEAYAIGLGAIRLNVAGRDPQGAVPAAEASDLADRLARELLLLQDPSTGERVVRQVHRRDDVYRGPHASVAPELQVGFEAGYRVGWSTTQGGVPSDVVTLNESPWNGDHASVDPSLVPGILLSDRLFQANGAGIADIGPTVLTLLGVPIPPDLDGVPLRMIERSP